MDSPMIENWRPWPPKLAPILETIDRYWDAMAACPPPVIRLSVEHYNALDRAVERASAGKFSAATVTYHGRKFEAIRT